MNDGLSGTHETKIIKTILVSGQWSPLTDILNVYEVTAEFSDGITRTYNLEANTTLDGILLGERKFDYNPPLEG